MIQEEIKQVENTQLHPYKYGFFSRSGYNLTKKYENVVLITLEEMFE